MRPDTAVPTTPRTYLLAEPSLPDLFKGQAKLLYVKKENPSLGQKIKDFFLRPLMIVAAKTSLLNVLQGSVFRDNKDAQKLTTHIKGLGIFEGVNEFRVKDFLADAALHGSRLPSPSGTTNKTEKSLAELTGAALNEHLNHPGYMYATLQEFLGTTTEGLDEFHSFLSDPSAELNEKQINKIFTLNKRMQEISNSTEESQLIPNEVFDKFFEIYNDFSDRQEAKIFLLSASNLIDRLVEIQPASTELECFLSFFTPNAIQFEPSSLKPLAKIFSTKLDDLAKILDPYGLDKTMRATLKILAAEFIHHAENNGKIWKTAQEIKELNEDIKKTKEDLTKHWG